MQCYVFVHDVVHKMCGMKRSWTIHRWVVQESCSLIYAFRVPLHTAVDSWQVASADRDRRVGQRSGCAAGVAGDLLRPPQQPRALHSPVSSQPALPFLHGTWVVTSRPKTRDRKMSVLVVTRYLLADVLKELTFCCVSACGCVLLDFCLSLEEHGTRRPYWQTYTVNSAQHCKILYSFLYDDPREFVFRPFSDDSGARV